MADKRTHFGRAGEFFIMSELLLRGWNVAVPVVDVGDDVFVVDDNDKTTWRIQVKTTSTTPVAGRPDTFSGTVTLSRAQLRAAQPIELFYVFLLRVESRWRFFVIPRSALLALRDDYVEKAKTRTGPGRRPVDDTTARTDALTMEILLSPHESTGWEASLNAYLDAWPDELAPVEGGPGAVGAKPQPPPVATPGEAPDP